MPTLFVKRVRANELGRTDGHQRGGILVPKRCTRFFPTLPDGSNPEDGVRVEFPQEGRTVHLRYIYYNRLTRDEYRLTPVPVDILERVEEDDLFVVRPLGENSYAAVFLGEESPYFDRLDSERGGRSGILLSDVALRNVPDVLTSPDETHAELGGGQGINITTEARQALEEHSMHLAREYYESRGYSVTDVSAHESYDLHCERANDERHVEVKGTQTESDTVLLTPNEVTHARQNADKAVLFVAHSLELEESNGEINVSGGGIRILDPWEVDSGNLTATGYTYELPEES